jgi:hypothetical protein
METHQVRSKTRYIPEKTRGRGRERARERESEREGGRKNRGIMGKRRWRKGELKKKRKRL